MGVDHQPLATQHCSVLGGSLRSNQSGGATELNDADRRDEPPEPSDPEAAKHLLCISCSGGLEARITLARPPKAGAYKNLLYQMRTFAKTERKQTSKELLPKISYFNCSFDLNRKYKTCN